MLEHKIFEFKYGKNFVKLETGIIARQSTSSVIASMDDTVVIVTIVCDNKLNLDNNFLPLSVYYQEKFYSVGKIPGSFFRREGRSSDIEIITSRLIDRSIRPLFKDNFLNDIQVIINVISVNPQISTDIISIIGTFAALSISGIPFIESLGVARIGYINNKYVLNPSLYDMNLSKLNLVVVGNKKNIFMIDCSSKNLHEEEILNAIYFGFNSFSNLIDQINNFSEGVLKKNLDIDFSYLNESLSKDVNDYINNFCYNDLKKIYLSYLNKIERYKYINSIKDNLFLNLNNDKKKFYNYLVLDKLLSIERKIISDNLIKYGKRIDGRYEDDIRDIDIKIGFLPNRVHGSSLFTRGETQALVTVTLGTSKDAQSFDDIFFGERVDNFIFHYNFPPYSVGEIGNIGIPKRREIGHGYLAKKGILPVLPNSDKFPYTIRVVSEIMESNGSSSMASVCGASLALMDAGVPINYHVAGVAMGLIKTDEKNFVISDIISDEDRLGDMDFKVIGTCSGVTALQMDIKINGVNCDIINFAFKKSKYSRLFILEKMNSIISNSKSTLSPFAPRIYKIKINVNQIKDVIGKGGSVIKSLTEENNCSIEIDNDGTVNIISSNKKDVDNVIYRIRKITENAKLGFVYLAKIIKIVEFGIFVSFLNNKEGLIHISQISIVNRRKNIRNFFKVGQHIYVKVLNIDENGRIKLSIKNNKIKKNSNI